MSNVFGPFMVFFFEAAIVITITDPIFSKHRGPYQPSTLGLQ